MIIARLAILAAKTLWRHPLRSGLTVLGVAMGMFLLATIETMHGAMRAATTAEADDSELVVYRENRFCPFTSRLPEHYTARIAAIPGVTAVTPMQVVVNNCGTSLDVVTFRGVSPERFADHVARRLRVIEGSLDAWHKRSDAALLGETLARRRGLSPGMSFDAAGITVHVVGIVASDEAQDRNVAYVHLPFLQRSSRTGLGVVTQFNVRVTDASHLAAVAEAIDVEFAHDSEPTQTFPEKAFLAHTAKDLVEIISFARAIGFGAMLAVIALVANTVLLTVRSRMREFAVLATIGYGDRAIAALVLTDGVLLGLVGGLLGVAGATTALSIGGYSISSEGLSIVFVPTMSTMFTAIALAVVLGLLAALLPAWRAARSDIVSCLRTA
jgi:putative ABC transport system permease protein